MEQQGVVLTMYLDCGCQNLGLEKWLSGSSRGPEFISGTHIRHTQSLTTPA